MILELIAALGVQIIFTNNLNIHCSSWHSSCYNTITNTIYIDYFNTSDYILYHELGHSLFFGDEEAIQMIAGYKQVREGFIYTSQLVANNEKIADYFALYMKDGRQFSLDHPSLYIYFSNKINKLI